MSPTPPTPQAEWRIKFLKQWGAVRVLNGNLSDTVLEIDFLQPVEPKQFSVKTLFDDEQLDSIQVDETMLSNANKRARVNINNGGPSYNQIQLMWRGVGEKTIEIEHIGYEVNGEMIFDEWPIVAINSAEVEKL